MKFPITNTIIHDQLVAKADTYLDLEAMGKRALAAHWQEATTEEQKIFLDLLWQLIENIAYPKSSKFMGNYQIAYPEVHANETGYEVHSLIKQEEEALDIKVVYHVYQKENQWKIDDVILDDVSIAEDLKYQFDKIITQSRFSGLLDKMREKLAEAQKENQALPASAA